MLDECSCERHKRAWLEGHCGGCSRTMRKWLPFCGVEITGTLISMWDSQHSAPSEGEYAKGGLIAVSRVW